MAVLAAILIAVAYNMGEWREIPELWKQGWTDRLVWLVTFTLTVLADLTVAVEAGMILAALLFIRRVSNTTTVSRVTRDYVERGRPHILQDKPIPHYVTIFRIHGPFLFGATEKLTNLLIHVNECAPIVILRLRNLTVILPSVDAALQRARILRENTAPIDVLLRRPALCVEMSQGSRAVPVYGRAGKRATFGSDRSAD